MNQENDGAKQYSFAWAYTKHDIPPIAHLEKICRLPEPEPEPLGATQFCTEPEPEPKTQKFQRLHTSGYNQT